jgi:hypothetical protein
MRKVIAEAFWDGVAKFCHYFGIARKVDTAVDFVTLGEYGYDMPPGVAIPVTGDPQDWQQVILDYGPSPFIEPPFDWSREPDRFPASPPTMVVAAKTGCAGGRGRRVEIRG